MRNSAVLTLVRQSWRSIWRNWRRTVITLSAISMGVGIALFFVSLGQGMYAKMVNTVVRSLGGHFSIEHRDYRDAPAIDLLLNNIDTARKEIEALPEIENSKALILGQAVLKSAQGTTGGAVMGIEPLRDQKLSDLADDIVEGEYLTNDDKARVLIGRGIADRLKLKVGKKLIISTNNIAGELSEKRFRVKGIFETGSPELDSYVVQMNIATAQGLFELRSDQVTQLGFLVKDLEVRDTALEKARAIITKHQHKDSVVLPWEDVQTELAGFITVDRSANWLLQSILIFLTLFTIWNTVLMSVLERKREFAVMLALGTPPKRIRAQVLVESAFVGSLGILIGIALGGGLAFYLRSVGIDIASLAGGEDISVAGFALAGKIRPKPEPAMFAWFGGLIFVATIIMSIVASRGVREIAVTDVLR